MRSLGRATRAPSQNSMETPGPGYPQPVDNRVPVKASIAWARSTGTVGDAPSIGEPGATRCVERTRPPGASNAGPVLGGRPVSDASAGRSREHGVDR